jgi:hypothetical protein
MPSSPSSLVPRHLLEAHLGLALLVWAGFTVAVGVVTAVISSFTAIEVSAWDHASQVVQWYVLAIGVHVGHSVLPLHITHGQTRREYMRQAMVFVGVFAAGVSALVTVSFVLEAGLYRLADWPQEVQRGQLYGGALELHLVYLQSWLLTTLWCAGGLFIAAAWYREASLGGLAIGLAVIFSGISGIAMSTDWGPFGGVYERLFGDDSIGGVLGVGIHIALIVAVLALTWRIVRDIPIKNKAA